MTSSGSVIGEIFDSRGRVYVEWDIPDYFDTPNYQKADNYFESPSFYFMDTKWCLRIYPNGLRLHNNVGNILLYLCMQDIFSNPTVHCKFGIKVDETVLGTKGYDCYNFSIEESILGSTICKRDDVQKFMRANYLDSTLTVFCYANDYLVANAASQTSQDSTTTAIALCRDFQNILMDKQRSDVTIEVQGQTFRAHKLILEARSTVFAAMFKHDMTEKNSNIIKIEDCDPTTFQTFLQYIYTAKFENVSCDSVINLYIAADKYCIIELKELCLKFMMENMSVETVCDVTVMADRYNETELKKSAETFLLQNIKTILLTDKWKSLMVENTAIAIDIFAKALPDEN